MENKKTIIYAIAATILIVAGVIFFVLFPWNKERGVVPPDVPIITPSPTPEEAVTIPTPAPIVIPIAPTSSPAVTVIAKNLLIPWDIAFLPNGEMLVTERGGDIVHIHADGTKTTINVPRPKPKGEGGLLGIVLHPNFTQNGLLYIYMTTGEVGSTTSNAVFRYYYTNDSLINEKTIISGIPGALYHDGGRLEFGPDGFLYITTGDAQTSAIAQDLKSLGGKLLRLTDEGAIPPGNPFGTAVYSYGHRNSQGLAWDPSGNLWSTEHGRSGVLSGYDELNLVTIGSNYGWPTVEGPASKEGMVSPVLQSGADDTWAPSSLLYYNGKLFFGALKGEALFEVTINGNQVSGLKKHFFKEFGRIRTVRLGPDGFFYITTSNRDGRGTPKAGDDKVIRLNPSLLK